MNFSIKALTIAALCSVIFSSLFFGLNQYESYQKSVGINSYSDNGFVNWVKERNEEAQSFKDAMFK